VVDLRGRIAIVTGSGGGGSGRAEALRLASESCSVIVSDINETGGRETLQLIKAGGGRAEFFRCDVSVQREVRALVTFAEERFGGLDILINNASGPGYRPGAPLEESYATIQTDLFGAIYGLQFALVAMKKRGGGSILNVSSTSALGHGAAHSGMAAYDIAKMGVIRLTTTHAHLLEAANVRVNCLVPDWIATPEVKAYYDSLTSEKRQNPRIPEVLTSLDEIAQAAIDLISDESLAGRVLVIWSGRKPALISTNDPGYSVLEPYPRIKPAGKLDTISPCA
jgi:NAD(P)-dependent dehydrogenase (short-subunit alcohol dehydrogenase family)